MIQWFNQLNELQQIFAFIAVPSTLILVLQTILLLFGIGDGDADIDGDGIIDSIGGDGLALFSIRGIMAFLCIGGWSGIALAGTNMNSVLVIMLATLCGFAALFGMAVLMRLMLSLQSSGNINLANAIGKAGTVYIPIPPAGKGRGKINVIVQGKYTEVSAISNETDILKTGETVRVVSTDETGLVVVERIKS